ncbi:hypothetical protein [Dysgonomonas sp. ZJ279]|uniref:hypothetical protein n=1 Tax=Dysgonomonas sp. ZJ279 TaxID=2709796 RepID=UPI0013EBD813|nr:hypothetical protein [Dysgonomonas sp. ZJ279]
MAKLNLKTISESVFKRYPNTDKVFVTSDGQAFFCEADAKNHAAKNRSGKELDVEMFRKDDGATFDLGELDRMQLEAFVTSNTLDIVFDETTSDDDLRSAIVQAIEVAGAKSKKSPKKAKK